MATSSSLDLRSINQHSLFPSCDTPPVAYIFDSLIAVHKLGTMAGFIQKGAKNILKKNPEDIVFLSALRTPVTRAKKGGLKDAHDHEMLATVCRSFLC